MAERKYVIVYEAQGRAKVWKTLIRTMKENGIREIRTSAYDDVDVPASMPLDPRNGLGLHQIDRKIYTIRVPEEEQIRAERVVSEICPDYTPYRRRFEQRSHTVRKMDRDTLSFVIGILAGVILMVVCAVLIYALRRSPAEAGIDYSGIIISGGLMVVLMMAAYYTMKNISQRLIRPDAGASSIAKSADDEQNRNVPKKTFDDIGGLKPLKRDLQVVVDILRNPDKYRMAGADLPRGILLVGPPGTGKTLIAQVMSNEAHVGFLYANASDFVEKYVGTGAARVRELFRKARQQSPCIVFIDEVDTLCTKRGGEMNAEDRKALTALLTEMDGFSKADNILVIGATNRIEDIDAAALRPGRFTEIYTVPVPETIEERLEVIDIYMKGKTFAKEFQREDFAREMIGRSPAEIKDVLNEAAIISVRSGLPYITNKCIEEAVYKRLMHGHQMDNSETDPRDLRLIAYHEAGHTLVSRLTGGRVSKVTIMPSTSGAGGVTFIDPPDRKLYTRSMMEQKVMEMYGGRAAEYLASGRDWNKTTQGCANDIEQATRILKNMVDAYGMSENGLVNMNVLAGTSTSRDSVRYIVKLSNELRDRTVELLENHYELLAALAEELLKKNTLYESEINEILGMKEEKAV